MTLATARTAALDLLRALRPLAWTIAFYAGSSFVFSLASREGGLLDPSGAPAWIPLGLGVGALAMRLTVLFVACPLAFLRLGLVFGGWVSNALGNAAEALPPD